MTSVTRGISLHHIYVSYHEPSSLHTCTHAHTFQKTYVQSRSGCVRQSSMTLRARARPPCCWAISCSLSWSRQQCRTMDAYPTALLSVTLSRALHVHTHTQQGSKLTFFLGSTGAPNFKTANFNYLNCIKIKNIKMKFNWLCNVG